MEKTGQEMSMKLEKIGNMQSRKIREKEKLSVEAAFSGKSVWDGRLTQD